jgi:hypothetical protein
MFSMTRWFPRLVCATVLLACADGTDPTAPSAVAASVLSQPLVDDDSTSEPSPELSGPSPEELATMPADFRMNPTLLDYWTDVGFIPAESRSYAQGYMKYFATNATQDVKLDLRFENGVIATRTAYGENTDLFPYVRSLWTTALLGVSGSCGHLADGATIHKAWHQFIAGGWKFFSWGTAAGTSGDMKEQVQCVPPPTPPPAPPGSTGGIDDSGGYQLICEYCQQWLEFTPWGDLLAVWWECEPVDMWYCETYL